MCTTINENNIMNTNNVNVDIVKINIVKDDIVNASNVNVDIVKIDIVKDNIVKVDIDNTFWRVLS